MKIIKMRHPYQNDLIPNDEVVLALGFFDGVHRGHQEVLKKARMVAEEKNLKLAAMTFDHHPSVVFNHRRGSTIGTKYLTSVERKATLMDDLGVDILYVVNFTSLFAKQNPEEFIQNYIIGLHAKSVVAGFDYTFGPQETANMTTLPVLSNGRFDVYSVNPVQQDLVKVSSTQTRDWIIDGDIDSANEFLGYPFETKGLVVHGEARGRTLGFPTANIISDINQITLGIGIYVAEIKIGSQWYHAMASVGRNVVFGDGRPVTTEINILDFNGEVYGETVKIRWYHRLRGEEKFASVEDLIDQLNVDEQNTRDFFKKL
ncbi:riboflavin biosynthesis protein RibF [Pediococcus argentinicus]|uniref:riboflavin biosynthesis protein RibF n=1 Tax=Pediococcus argentinicus TaxID=480391 RepID=UPI00338D42D7